MNRKNIRLEIDSKDHGFLACDYELYISRKQDSNERGKWWVPIYNAGLMSALLTTDDDEYEWEFCNSNSSEMPRELKDALKDLDGELSDLIDQKAKEIVNDINFQDNANAGEPRDD